MPHDMKGKKLKPGDRVMVPCVVREVSQADGLNLTLETVKTVTAGTDPLTDTVTFQAASRQVKKTEAKVAGGQ